MAAGRPATRGWRSSPERILSSWPFCAPGFAAGAQALCNDCDNARPGMGIRREWRSRASTLDPHLRGVRTHSIHAFCQCPDASIVLSRAGQSGSGSKRLAAAGHSGGRLSQVSDRRAGPGRL
jgi:hypothetical protein